MPSTSCLVPSTSGSPTHARPAQRRKSAARPASPPNAADSALVADVLAGKAGAFDELHRQYAHRIYGFCRSRLADPVEAEDVTQEVFLQVHRSLHRFEGRSPLLSWMLGIALNQLRRRWRRAQVATVPLDESGSACVLDRALAPDRVAEAAGMLRRCDEVLHERVSESHQIVFELRYASGKETREIAECLGKSNQAVKMSLHRTRRVLVEAVA